MGFNAEKSVNFMGVLQSFQKCTFLCIFGFCGSFSTAGKWKIEKVQQSQKSAGGFFLPQAIAGAQGQRNILNFPHSHPTSSKRTKKERGLC